MNTGGIQRILACGDSHEARTLLIRLGAKLRHLKELGSGCELSIFLTVHYNVLGNYLADTGNVFQKG